MKNQIIFTSNVEGVIDDEAIYPQPANKFLPEWYKDIPVQHKNATHFYKKFLDIRTVKACPSFTDIFNLGYVIVAPFDVWFNLEDNGETKMQTPHPRYIVDEHSNKQFVNYHPGNVRKVFKINSPFRVFTPKNYSIMQLPMFYHFNPDFYVPYGIIDTDKHHEINHQIMYTSTDNEIFIRKGTPLCYLVPFNRKNKLELKIDKDYSKYKSRVDSAHHKVFSVFKNGYVKSEN